MTRMRTLLPVALIAAGLVVAPLAGAATADGTTEASCSESVPCGYIYPLIIIEPKDDQDVRTLPSDGGEVEVEATLTWTFSITQEGFTVNDPTEPIEVTFEFPRKPAWAGMSVEPSKFEVPISPQYIEPSEDPTEGEARYVYQKDITIKMSQKSQAVLRPGEDVADLLVFAKSSESGLYKPSYGIKELSVDPEDAVVRAESQDDVDAQEVPSFPVPSETRSLGPVDVALEGAEDATVFDPAPVRAKVAGPDGDVPSTVSMSLVDEEGTLLYATGPRDTRDGALFTNLTFPEPGSYRVLVTASPGEGADVSWHTGTVAFPVTVPGTDADAVQLDNQYTARYHEVVSEFHGEPGDPASQYEKFIPLPVYEDANGANLLFELGTDNPAAATPSGAANLNVELRDPNGGIVAKGTFDPANPTLRMPVNALPGDGLYQIRVFGQGGSADSLAGASYDVQVSTSYDGAPVLNEVRDGTLDAPGTAAHGPVSIETKHEHYDPWTPQELTIPVTGSQGNGTVDAEASVTILTPDGERVVSTGWEDASDGEIEANVTFPDLGRHLAAVHVRTPMGNGTHVQPTTLASTLHVGGHGEAQVTLPDAYQATHTVEVPAGSGGEEADVRSFPVDLRSAAGAVEATLSTDGGPGEDYHVAVLGPDGSQVADASGSGGEITASAESGLDPGRYEVRVTASAPDGAVYDLGIDVPYTESVTAENPLFAGTASEEGASASGADDGYLTPATPAAALAALMGAGLVLRRRD